jgi:hypothetical protein
MSIISYDKDLKFHKSSLNKEAKVKIASELVDKHDAETQNQHISRALDKILIAHRNSKLFFLLMSGPFIITLKLI